MKSDEFERLYTNHPGPPPRCWAADLDRGDRRCGAIGRREAGYVYRRPEGAVIENHPACEKHFRTYAPEPHDQYGGPLAVIRQ